MRRSQSPHLLHILPGHDVGAIDHPHDESCPQLTVLEALGFNRFESDETNVSIAKIVAGIADASRQAVAAPIPFLMFRIRRLQVCPCGDEVYLPGMSCRTVQ